jgi:integrase
LQPPPQGGSLSFRELAAMYKERHVIGNGLALARTIDYRLKPLLDHFGDRPIIEIRTADVEDFIGDLRKRRIVHGNSEARPLANASINRSIELLRHMLNWAVGREYLDRTPFRRGTETLIRKLREDNRRHRRLTEEEEARLLQVSQPVLRSLIITALDTGMRRGEMLALRFGDVDWDRQVVMLRPETTKSGKGRIVPLATARLRAVLEWLQLQADGERKPDAALVFSDATGESVGSFRTAWITAVLWAHTVNPEWRMYGWTALTQDCHEQFRRINLHWHDLRHEYASRLVERGVPLSQVRDLLGHASIVTTERYDNQQLERLQVAAGKLESGKLFQAPTLGSGTEFHISFTNRPPGGTVEPVTTMADGRKLLRNQAVENWLGGRDSNPDNVVQSHVSYR